MLIKELWFRPLPLSGLLRSFLPEPRMGASAMPTELLVWEVLEMEREEFRLS